MIYRLIARAEALAYRFGFALAGLALLAMFAMSPPLGAQPAPGLYAPTMAEAAFNIVAETEAPDKASLERQSYIPNVLNFSDWAVGPSAGALASVSFGSEAAILSLGIIR